jgi:hypothetical protein
MRRRESQELLQSGSLIFERSTAMKRMALLSGLAYASAFAMAVGAQQPSTDGPKYLRGGTSLVRPTDYREWIFLSSGLDMAYPPPGAAPQSQLPPRHSFTNVFVNPSSYRSFVQTGKWADGTIFVLEARGADGVSKYFPANQTGQFQTTFAGLEANVKDSRFPDGWAFFGFNGTARSAEPLSGDALARGQCVECHTKETAVERTFVQFYPTLLPIARQKGTVKPGF